MKKISKYLVGALIGASILAGQLGIALARSKNDLHVQRLIPVATTYGGVNRELNIPVYEEISNGNTFQCAKYVRLVAQDVFGKKYKPANAWDLQYHNPIVAQVGDNTLESLADQGTLQPGMVVGVHYPRSGFNEGVDEKGLPREYSHVIIYLGDDPSTSEPLFADQVGKQTRIQTEGELRRGGLAPYEILTSRN